MADLGTYFGLGYRLDITSQLATTYTEARTTFTLGNQTSLGTAGLVTASGVAKFYAITNPTGSVLVETGSLKTGQPVVLDFSFTVDDFASGNPKVVPQGHDGQGASQRIRSRKPKVKAEETAGKKLNKALDEALAPPPAPEPTIEVAVEAPSLPPPETPQPPAPVEVVPAPEPVVSLLPVDTGLIAANRAFAKTRTGLADSLLAKQQAERTARAEAIMRESEAKAEAEKQAKDREEAQRKFEEEQRQDEQDALEAIEAMMQSLEAPEPAQPALKVEDISKAVKEAIAELVASKPKTITIKRGPDGRITGGTLS